MALVDAIREFLAGYRIERGGVLVAISAGPDSTALLLALCEMRSSGVEVSAGHVNHHLRGGDSEADEQFVRKLCGEFDVSLQVADGSLSTEGIKATGVEAEAREVRYRLLAQMRDHSGARWIATAHTRDDQAETVLLRLITGSGFRKLQGIRPQTPDGIIRPLLDVPRSEIEEYLRDRGVEARLDASNRDSRFLRNRIRRELMPLLKEINPSVVQALARTAAQVREASEALEPLLRDQEAGWVLESEDDAVFDLSAAPEQPWLIRTALIRQIRRLDPSDREISSADLERIASGLHGTTRLTISPRLELERRGVLVTLRRARQKPRR